MVAKDERKETRIAAKLYVDLLQWTLGFFRLDIFEQASHLFLLSHDETSARLCWSEVLAPAAPLQIR